MSLAHKPVMLRDSDYNKIAYCSICGQEDFSADCPGDFVLSSKEQTAIDDALEQGFKEIFGSRSEFGSKYLKEVLDSERKGI